MTTHDMILLCSSLEGVGTCLVLGMLSKLKFTGGNFG